MSLKRYSGGTWADIENLRKYSGGSWASCAAAKKYSSGTWEIVWASGPILGIDKTWDGDTSLFKVALSSGISKIDLEQPDRINPYNNIQFRLITDKAIYKDGNNTVTFRAYFATGNKISSSGYPTINLVIGTIDSNDFMTPFPCTISSTPTIHTVTVGATNTSWMSNDGTYRMFISAEATFQRLYNTGGIRIYLSDLTLNGAGINILNDSYGTYYWSQSSVGEIS